MVRPGTDSSWNSYAVSRSSAVARWWGQDWGKTNAGSICPAAPEKPEAKRPPPAHAGPLGSYIGTVDTAWTMQGNTGWNYWWGFDPSIPPSQQKRAGSYTFNGWLSVGWWGPPPAEQTTFWNSHFANDNAIQNPSQTPAIADGLHMWWWGSGVWHGPRAEEPPAVNLRNGAGGSPFGMSGFTMPRHGSRPRTLSTNHHRTAKLPGAINVAFYDGHVEQVKLEDLWKLSWHRNYVPPRKRPGLK